MVSYVLLAVSQEASLIGWRGALNLKTRQTFERINTEGNKESISFYREL